MRRAAKIDNNQAAIVEALRSRPGISVEPGHDDILVGYNHMTFWFEIKSYTSKRTGQVLESAKTLRQKRLDNVWRGQRDYVTTLSQVLEIIGYTK